MKIADLGRYLLDSRRNVRVNACERFVDSFLRNAERFYIDTIETTGVFTQRFVTTRTHIFNDGRCRNERFGIERTRALEHFLFKALTRC